MTTLEKIKQDLQIVGSIKYPRQTIPVAIKELQELVDMVDAANDIARKAIKAAGIAAAQLAE